MPVKFVMIIFVPGNKNLLG